MTLKLSTWIAASLMAVASAAHANTRQQQGHDANALTGGIGQAEQARLQQAADNYSLALTFSDRAGRYMADVDVQVKDRSGSIVYSRESTGPMVLVDLPPGNYTVEASHQGRLQGHRVDVSGQDRHSVILSWPVAGAQAG